MKDLGVCARRTPSVIFIISDNVHMSKSIFAITYKT